MAEAALASIAKSALQLFTSLAKDEFLLLWNSPKDLKRLEATIETVSNIHQDTQQRGSLDDSVKHCLAELRSIMYDAEDLFDGLASQILHKRTTTGNAFTKEVLLFFSDANQLGVFFKTAHAVKAIRESLDDIKKDMEIYGLIRQQPPLVQPFVRDKTHSFVHNNDVIGRDEDRDRIIKMLLPGNEGESLSVIAIIGFGGLGKTTLAQYVYNNESVKHGFDVHLWACINDLSNLELVLIEIIASEEVRHSNLGLEKLQQKLRELISGRKFLLVLDDVWDENPRNWLKLEPFLRCGKTGSRVLVTTRSRKVVECLDASKPNCCVDLAVLSDESAWSLFVQKAFYSKEEVSEYPELEPLGKKIVHRCGNLPLAIVVIGSLLRGRGKNEIIWSDFLDSEFKMKISTSGKAKHESIKKVLMFSYNDLFPNLKLCFAYCSLFPKDYVFDKDELVRLWLAQGFIKPCAERSLEEEGEEYFFHLVERCFFQEVKQKEYFKADGGATATAKMHDLLHDLAIYVAEIESVFVDKVSKIKEGKKDNLRHISISCDLDDSSEYCSQVSDPKKVRSLLIHHGKQSSKDSLNLSLGRFKMLRTLHLVHLGINNISESIGELIHLRYLDLSCNIRLKHLPNSICKLHHLMILVLEYCIALEELPPKIENLVSLRQLYVRGCERLSSLPSGLTALTSLVNLDRLVVHPHTGGLRYLQGLDNLRGTVTIEFPKEGWLDAIEDATKANMSRKSKLSRMVLEWKVNNTMPEAKALLDALEPHTNIEYLKISWYCGEMLSSWFGTLKNVTELYLHRCLQVEYLEDKIRGNMYFPCLKFLTLDYLESLKGWWRQQVEEETERPRLTKVSLLHIAGCKGLKGRRMPLFEQVEDLHLDTVDMELVTEFLTENIYPNCSPMASFSPVHKNNKLKQLTLARIDDLKSFPEGWLRRLTQLQKLDMRSCDRLKWVSCRGLLYLTALKDLSLPRDCEIADVGDDDEEMGITEAGMPWKALKGLESLTISALSQHLIEGLEFLTSLKSLEVTKWKDEEEVGDEEREASQVELSFKALHNLQTLKIGFDCGKARLPKVIQYLPSLQDLSILNCEELHLGWKTLLSRKLQRLEFGNLTRVINVEDMVVVQQSQLWALKIWNAEAEWVENVPWNSLSSLDTLDLKSIGGMEQLPDGIQHLTSLRNLYIWGCEEMRSFPTWIPKLTSLQHLGIDNCSVELERRCKEQVGEDWLRNILYKYVRAREEGNKEATNDSRGDEEQGEGSRKKGLCGLPLPKFKL